MNPITLLISRPSALRGLGLIATISALSGPLSLEVLFSHADLWFAGGSAERVSGSVWQDRAFPLVWWVWTLMGVLVTSSWGLDRGFTGITPHLHQRYSLLLSVLGVSIYLIFGTPFWSWLYTMRLAEVGDILFGMFLSSLTLFGSACLASLSELHLSTLSGLSIGIGSGGIALLVCWWMVVG